MSHSDVNRERRDAEIARPHNAQMASPFYTKVVGVSFVPSHPDNLLVLNQSQLEADERGEPLTVVLVRNPDNQYDANAIEVHVPALGDEWAMIGHLMRPIAARLAPELDAGVKWAACVESVLIHPDYMSNPGISIKCARVELSDAD